MTQDEKIEGNKLLAEFMELELYPISKFIKQPSYVYKSESRLYSFDRLKFHSDWNWLMSACRKWDDIYLHYSNFNYEDYRDYCDILDSVVTCYEIEPIFNQLVECIKWFNTNDIIKIECTDTIAIERTKREHYNPLNNFLNL